MLGSAVRSMPCFSYKTTSLMPTRDLHRTKFQQYTNKVVGHAEGIAFWTSLPKTKVYEPSNSSSGSLFHVNGTQKAFHRNKLSSFALFGR